VPFPRADHARRSTRRYGCLSPASDRRYPTSCHSSQPHRCQRQGTQTAPQRRPRTLPFHMAALTGIRSPTVEANHACASRVDAAPSDGMSFVIHTHAQGRPHAATPAGNAIHIYATSRREISATTYGSPVRRRHGVRRDRLLPAARSGPRFAIGWQSPQPVDNDHSCVDVAIVVAHCYSHDRTIVAALPEPHCVPFHFRNIVDGWPPAVEGTIPPTLPSPRTDRYCAYSIARTVIDRRKWQPLLRSRTLLCGSPTARRCGSPGIYITVGCNCDKHRYSYRWRLARGRFVHGLAWRVVVNKPPAYLVIITVVLLPRQ